MLKFIIVQDTIIFNCYMLLMYKSVSLCFILHYDRTSQNQAGPFCKGKVKENVQKKTDEKATAVSHGKQKNNKKIKSNTIKKMK